MELGAGSCVDDVENYECGERDCVMCGGIGIVLRKVFVLFFFRFRWKGDF